VKQTNKWKQFIRETEDLIFHLMKHQTE